MRLVPIIALLAVAAPLPLSAQVKDHAPTDLSSASALAHDKADSESWTYVKPGLDLTLYSGVLIDQTEVYAGADAEFGRMSVEEHQKYADLVTGALRTEVPKSYPVKDAAGLGVLRLKVTLLGASKTVGGVATVTRVLPVGLLLNGVKSIAGKKGSFSGSLLYAVELSDGSTGELEVAAIRRRAPDALDIGSTVSTTDTAKAVATYLAKTIGQKLAAASMGTPTKPAL